MAGPLTSYADPQASRPQDLPRKQGDLAGTGWTVRRSGRRSTCSRTLWTLGDENGRTRNASGASPTGPSPKSAQPGAFVVGSAASAGRTQPASPLGANMGANVSEQA